MEFQCLTVCGLPVSYTIVDFQCFTRLWNSSISQVWKSSVSNGCGIPVSHIANSFQYFLAMIFQCVLWLWNSCVSQDNGMSVSGKWLSPALFYIK